MKQNFTVRQSALDGVAAFLSVAQHHSFRRAVAELGVTPSAISQAVRALQAGVGAAPPANNSEAARAFIDQVKSRSDAANKPRIHVGDRQTGGVKIRGVLDTKSSVQ
jgi:Bacterial regulatory helix-turn-helix protein, lysR family